MKKKTKKIKCYIEIYPNDDFPTVMLKKPTQREVKNAKEFGYDIYPCEILIDLSKKL